jgi:putative nucleotidyltransferase with HDIG domain
MSGGGEFALLGQILELANDEEVVLEHFGRVVAQSPSLAVKIVKVANSALYGMEGRITRLERAVLILGVRAVASIASSVLASTRMKGVRLGSLRGDALWLHSLETGVCAELTARCLGLPNEAEAYLAGLLHDMGLLEMQDAHGKRWEELFERSMRDNLPLEVLEQEAFGTTHAALLASKAKEWGFPEKLRDAIGGHHNPDLAPESTRAITNMVRVAHLLVSEPTAQWKDAPVNAEADAAVLRDLGLGDDDITDIRTALAERLKDLTNAFAG